MSKQKKSAKKLIELYEELGDERQHSLFDFANYLHSLGDLVNQEIAEPENIPRPQEETVVGAIKRLKATYHMIGRMSVFSDASALMTEHMIKGRDSVEVIDEMEKLFDKAYQDLIREKS